MPGAQPSDPSYPAPEVPTASEGPRGKVLSKQGDGPLWAKQKSVNQLFPSDLACHIFTELGSFLREAACEEYFL